MPDGDVPRGGVRARRVPARGRLHGRGRVLSPLGTAAGRADGRGAGTHGRHEQSNPRPEFLDAQRGVPHLLVSSSAARRRAKSCGSKWAATACPRCTSGGRRMAAGWQIFDCLRAWAAAGTRSACASPGAASGGRFGSRWTCRATAERIEVKGACDGRTWTQGAGRGGIVREHLGGGASRERRPGEHARVARRHRPAGRVRRRSRRGGAAAGECGRPGESCREARWRWSAQVCGPAHLSDQGRVGRSTSSSARSGISRWRRRARRCCSRTGARRSRPAGARSRARPIADGCNAASSDAMPGLAIGPGGRPACR